MPILCEPDVNRCIKHEQFKASRCRDDRRGYIERRIIDFESSNIKTTAISERESMWTMGVLSAALVAATSKNTRFKVKRTDSNGSIRVRYYGDFAVTWFFTIIPGHGYILDCTSSSGIPPIWHVASTKKQPTSAVDFAVETLNQLLLIDFQSRESRILQEKKRQQFDHQQQEVLPPLFTSTPDDVADMIHKSAFDIMSSFYHSESCQVSVEKCGIVEENQQRYVPYPNFDFQPHTIKWNKFLLQINHLRFEILCTVGYKPPAGCSFIHQEATYFTIKCPQENNNDHHDNDRKIYFDRRSSIKDNFLHAIFFMHARVKQTQ